LSKYIHSEEIHNLKTPTSITPLIMEVLNPKSVLDVGCGLGTWLKSFEQLGVHEILGVDSNWVDRKMLKILPNQFYVHDLTEPLNLQRKFDLVISLEVAEHVDESLSKQFVQSLVNHGDLILFSAAIPGQGGQHHVNEKWLSAWVEIFKLFNYKVFDFIRPAIWNDPAIELWYKQNIVLFCKEGHPLELPLRKYEPAFIDMVHPELFTFYRNQAERSIQLEQGRLGFQLAMKAFVNALINKFK